MLLYQDFMDAEYRIFGLHKIVDGKCGCGDANCKTIGKHPIASNWQHSPDWSDDQLEVMQMSGQLSTGYGVLVAGLLVVDVDARNGGIKSYERLLAEMPAIAGAGLIVETGSGNGSKHLYFSLAEPLALMQSHPDYKGIDFKSTGFCVGPGSLHASGKTYEAVVGTPHDITPAPAELLALLQKPERHRAEYNGQSVDVSEQDISDMLGFIDPDCDHEAWYRIGMAVHHATGGTGFHLWDNWSNQGSKYPGRVTLEKRWHSFGKSANPVTFGTLLHYAEQAGWEDSVTFTPTVQYDAPAQATEGLPFSIDGVDLLRPPGFVGEVCKWINSQCRYPRETLACAAALVAMGNVCGLRYTDDLDGVTANLFAFCVAGSGTGKEAVQQAIAEVHRAAGIHGATHGAIKSEQEVIRNLIRNQAACYIIDEIGIFLQKIANAQQRGGAAYLDGVIGILMSAYSKADGFMLLTGDTKDDVRRALLQELAQCKKAVASFEDDSGAAARRVPQLERAVQHIDNGLERPFLSLIGFTTPVTFDGLVTHEQATNGFIGRSLLINERETNPRARRGFRKSAMPDKVRYALAQLYSGGAYDSEGGMRVEYYGDRVAVRTDAAAVDMLSQALDWVEDHAELHKERTGLEAVVRRGYEIMAKISLILAAPSGIRTTEHVRWAFAMMRRDIEEKTRLAYANENQKQAPEAALMARILNLIDKDHGETVAVIANRTHKSKQEAEQVLQKMADSGLVIQQEVRHPVNGKVSDKWFAV
jgi:hypothetical protein